MKILYLSRLEDRLHTGPANSVPAQIKAQSQLDEVFWLNLTDAWRQDWSATTFRSAFGAKYLSVRLKDIEKVFACPDLAIFEGFYEFPFMKLVADLNEKNIPYVIVPRSQLTEAAQKQKALKKILGNFVYFEKFLQGAAAVHYLTEQEKSESAKWHVKNFVIPNGITKREFFLRPSPERISAVYIGRINIYQKGLALLLEACAEIKAELEKKFFSLKIYGANEESVKDTATLNDMIKNFGLENFIEILPAIFGADKKSVLENANLFVMTSRFEGLPMALLEALSYSLPCFVTTGTNMAEEIQESGAGNIAKIDVANIADELLKLIEDFPATYKAMSKNANALAQKYSWSEIAKQSHEIYQNLGGQ